MINDTENEAENKKIITNLKNWYWPRHGHKYTKYKILFSIIIVICN